MDIKIVPTPLRGTIEGIPSKSVLHRALICAALAAGQSRIGHVIHSDDIESTKEALGALGAGVSFEQDTIIVQGISGRLTQEGPVHIDCKESGSTLRFLIPVAAALGAETLFEGSGRLPVRPLKTYFDLLPHRGVAMSHPKELNLPLHLKGRLTSGIYILSGAVSSQYITGLLLALPLCEGDSVILVEEPFESRGYVDITLEVMKHFGIEVAESGNEYRIKGGQQYKSTDMDIEGDWSQAAFWLCAGALGGDITMYGMNAHSRQGDAAVLDILRQFGAEITVAGDGGIRCRGGQLRAVEIDAGQIPDIIPILSVVAAAAEGISRIWNAGRLRFKESDRLASTAEVLTAIGADVKTECDELIIKGKKSLRGGTAQGYGDHRIVMALAISAAICEKPVIINGYECVSKSYPHFF